MTLTFNAMLIATGKDYFYINLYRYAIDDVNGIYWARWEYQNGKWIRISGKIGNVEFSHNRRLTEKTILDVIGKALNLAR